MLCGKCKAIDFSWFPPQAEPSPDSFAWTSLPSSELPSDVTGRYFAFAHHPSVEALVRSAAQGCHFCTQALGALVHIGLLVDSPHEYHGGPIEIRWYPHAPRIRNAVRGREIFAVARTGLRDIKARLLFVEYDCDKVETWQPCLGPILRDYAVNRSPSTGCQENFSLGRVWLGRCLASHSLCTLASPLHTPLPTRLLDLQAPCCASGIRLVDASARHGPYITLSHAWGKRRILTTTRSTIGQRQEGIALAELPKTFRDAVRVARELAVRYLWIDSLCGYKQSSLPSQLAFQNARETY